jgi:raffinose/stachyose/melibiose transport system permease protein
VGLNRYTWTTLARELGVIGFAGLFLIPIYLLTTFSVKSQADIVLHPLSFPTHPTAANYRHAWKGTGILTLGQAMLSSLIITVGSVLVLLVVGSITGYTIARRPSRLSSGLYYLVVLAFIIPFQLGVVPLYVAMRHLQLTGSYLGMIVLYSGLMMPLTVFLYVGFIRAMPRDYEESAIVDGASMLRTFARVVLPLLRPITGTVAVLTGIFIWNDFFNPLIFLSGTHRATLPVVIYGLVNEFSDTWNLVFAAVVIALLPVLAFFIFAQKQLMRGFSGGIRG